MNEFINKGTIVVKKKKFLYRDKDNNKGRKKHRKASYIIKKRLGRDSLLEDKMEMIDTKFIKDNLFYSGNGMVRIVITKIYDKKYWL